MLFQKLGKLVHFFEHPDLSNLKDAFNFLILFLYKMFCIKCSLPNAPNKYVINSVSHLKKNFF